MANRIGFTLVEVLMSVTIMSVMAGVMTLSYHAADQTPKREADKVAAYIMRLVRKSDRIKMSFDVKVSENALSVSWGKHGENKEPSFDVSAGLMYGTINCTDEILIYDYKNYPIGAKITVLDSTITSNSDRHKYITISHKNASSPHHYVLITSYDIE